MFDFTIQKPTWIQVRYSANPQDLEQILQESDQAYSKKVESYLAFHTQPEEHADLSRVIQNKQGYLSSDFKLRKIKIEQGTWMNDGTAAAKIKSPVPMDFIQIDSLAINEYIKRKGGRDYIHKVLSDYWRKR